MSWVKLQQILELSAKILNYKKPKFHKSLNDTDSFGVQMADNFIWVQIIEIMNCQEKWQADTLLCKFKKTPHKAVGEAEAKCLQK